MQAESLEMKGRDLASPNQPANGRLSWIRVQTPSEGWEPPDIRRLCCILASHGYEATKLGHILPGLEKVAFVALPQLTLEMSSSWLAR